MEQIDDLKDLDVPNLGTLQAWDAQASTAGCPANGNSNKRGRCWYRIKSNDAESRVEIAYYYILLVYVSASCGGCFMTTFH